MRLRTIFSLFFAVFFASLGRAQSFPNVRISDPGLRNPEEVSIALNPRDPNQLAAGANLNYFFYSNDGGWSWHWKQLSSPYGFWGDPNLLFDDSGVLYYEHLSGNHWMDSEFLERIVVQRSTDAGLSFDSGAQVGYDPPTMQDKAWFGLDRSPTGSNGTIFTSWNEDDKYGSTDPKDSSRIFFSESTDRGRTWCSRVRVDHWGGDCLDSSNTIEGAVATAGPNGEVYVVWSGHNKIYFNRSLDHGRTFGLERAIADQPGGWDFKVPGIFRVNGFPMIASDLDPQSKYYGRLYVMWSDQRRGVTDVYSIYSSDGGKTWSAPLRVNTDSAMSHHFLPSLAIDPTTGHLFVVFYDRRNYVDDQTDVYLARSTDGGASFDNERISQSAFGPVAKVFFGDYIHIAAFDRHIYPIWMRMDDSVTSVWTAIVSDTGNGPVAASMMQQQEPQTAIWATGNPAAPGVAFSSESAGHVRIELFDLLGRRVGTLLNGDYGPGQCRFGLPENIPDGTYVAKLTTPGKQAVATLVVAR